MGKSPRLGPAIRGVRRKEGTMLAEKRRVTLDELESQVALDLPDREMMLVTVVITNVLNNLSIEVDVRNNRIAAQICAVVELLNAELLTTDQLTCTIQQ
jgi:hypothetical protein